MTSMTNHSNSTLYEIELPLDKIASGKVREIFDAGEGRLLLVTTDRLSAFDVIMPDPVPGKGRVLNQMSLFWFDRFADRVENTVIERDPGKMDCLAGLADETLASLAGRSVLMRRAEMFPVECVVRGYLAGSGYKDYLKSSSLCGIVLPPGLKKADRLPEPLYTPSTKAEQCLHDENISFERTVELVGGDIAARLRYLSLSIYSEAAAYALERGIIIADTKFEFGMLGDRIVLADEVMTPDSSRFWPEDGVVPGEEPPSYDKQIVRNWLEQSGWEKKPPAPRLPADILGNTSAAYLDIFRKLTGREVS